MNLDSIIDTKSQIILDTDIGFDFDDFGALLLALFHERLTAVITTLYHPEEKKAASQSLISRLVEEKLLPDNEKINSVVTHHFSGEGYYRNDLPEKFDETYPRWPSKIFGDASLPVSKEYKCIYPFQLKAFDDHRIALDISASASEIEKFLGYLESLSEPITIVSTGPTTNLATLIRKNPELVREKVKSIVMMNGTFLDPARMGYNGGLNLDDTQTVFSFDIPCIIIPSHLCKNLSLPNDLLIRWKEERDSLPEFGQFLLAIMENWEIHRARKKDPDVDVSKLSLQGPILADPLAMLVALDPSLVGKSQTVRYEFPDNEGSKKVHLLHPDSSKFVQVVEDPSSHIIEVQTLKNPELVQETLIKFFDDLLHCRDPKTAPAKGSKAHI